MRFRETALALPAALLLGAAVAGPVDLSQAWAPPAPQGAETSLMMVLKNEGSGRDDLRAVACAGVTKSEILAPPPRGGTPQPVQDVPLPGGATVRMTPASVHVRLIGLLAPLVEGQRLRCTATFVRTGERLFEAFVQPGAPPAPPLD